MRTGNKSTNNVTGEKYQKAFHDNEMLDVKKELFHMQQKILQLIKSWELMVENIQ